MLVNYNLKTKKMGKYMYVADLILISPLRLHQS